MITASPFKLRSGEWGARVKGSVSEGDTIRITTQSGKSWDATVRKVVWSGKGVSMVATESTDRPRGRGRQRSRGKWTGCSCGSIEDHPRDSDCESCRFDNYDC